MPNDTFNRYFTSKFCTLEDCTSWNESLRASHPSEFSSARAAVTRRHQDRTSHPWHPQAWQEETAVRVPTRLFVGTRTASRPRRSSGRDLYGGARREYIWSVQPTHADSVTEVRRCELAVKGHKMALKFQIMRPQVLRQGTAN